jgi:hypothetical protein
MFAISIPTDLKAPQVVGGGVKNREDLWWEGVKIPYKSRPKEKAALKAALFRTEMRVRF